MGKIPFFSKKKTSETDTGKEIFHCELPFSLVFDDYLLFNSEFFALLVCHCDEKKLIIFDGYFGNPMCCGLFHLTENKS